MSEWGKGRGEEGEGKGGVMGEIGEVERRGRSTILEERRYWMEGKNCVWWEMGVGFTGKQAYEWIVARLSGKKAYGSGYGKSGQSFQQRPALISGLLNIHLIVNKL